MTKTEKKELVFDLVEDFRTSTNPDELKALEKKIIKEVSDCPFSEEIREVFELSLLSWTYDIDVYIDEKSNGNHSQNGNELALTSIVGIYNFIDVCLLD